MRFHFFLDNPSLTRRTGRRSPDHAFAAIFTDSIVGTAIDQLWVWVQSRQQDFDITGKISKNCAPEVEYLEVYHSSHTLLIFGVIGIGYPTKSWTICSDQIIPWNAWSDFPQISKPLAISLLSFRGLYSNLLRLYILCTHTYIIIYIILVYIYNILYIWYLQYINT